MLIEFYMILVVGTKLLSEINMILYEKGVKK